MDAINLSSSTEISAIGIMHLKRYWQKCQLKKAGKINSNDFADEWNLDTTMLAALGLGLEQTIGKVFICNNFLEFENWIKTITCNHFSLDKINHFNQFISNQNKEVNEQIEKVLSNKEINFWNEYGYIIIPNAVPINDCGNAIDVICEFINIDKNDSKTWYQPHPSRQGIMVQLFQHPILQKNRESPKIKAAYEQLWNRKDIWQNTDRVGFNPPETDCWKFPGPSLHWDVSLQQPIPFGLQGILYLADTEANQGAFTLVPGFHNKIENWLNNLPPNANARTENLYELGTKPIEANAGDFIIWHQALPHGSSPNHSKKPRFVQYINYAPLNMEERKKWI